MPQANEFWLILENVSDSGIPYFPLCSTSTAESTVMVVWNASVELHITGKQPQRHKQILQSYNCTFNSFDGGGGINLKNQSIPVTTVLF